MPAHNRRTDEQPLSNPPRRSVAKRDAPRRAAARKAPDNGAKPGDSQSLENEVPIAQIDGLGIESVRRSVDALQPLSLARRVVKDVFGRKAGDESHGDFVDSVWYSFRDDMDNVSRGFGPISVLRAMEIHGFRCNVRSPYLCRKSSRKRGTEHWFVGFTQGGATGWNGRDDYCASGESLAIAVARAAVFTLACKAKLKRGGR